MRIKVNWYSRSLSRKYLNIVKMVGTDHKRCKMRKGYGFEKWILLIRVPRLARNTLDTMQGSRSGST